MRRIPLLAASLTAFAASALAGSVDEAKQFLDQAAPRHCELLTLKYQAESLQDPAAREQLTANLRKRAADLDREMAPAMQRFEAARATLTPDEREQLGRHASALLEACAGKAAATYNLRIPLPAGPPAPRPKAMPYTPPVPPMEKSIQSQARPGAIQAELLEK